MGNLSQYCIKSVEQTQTSKFSTHGLFCHGHGDYIMTKVPKIAPSLQMIKSSSSLTKGRYADYDGFGEVKKSLYYALFFPGFPIIDDDQLIKLIKL